MQVASQSKFDAPWGWTVFQEKRNHLKAVQHMLRRSSNSSNYNHKLLQMLGLRTQELRRLFVPRSQRSFDDEFRSPRSIALGLYKRYRNVVKGGFTNNLQEFINAVVTAYAVGCTEEGLRKELLSTDVSREEVEECILWVIIVFTTIMSSPPPTVIRWSKTVAVTAESLLEWKGFCSIIANAYYNRGMAWLPVSTLQLEQMAALGRAEEPSLVADRMRLAFTTLEIVCPQWPKK